MYKQPPEHSRFKKGQSGNPKGRPKLPDIKDAVAKILSDEKEGKNALDAILSAMRSKATKGDVRAAEFLIDRGYGKPNQKVENTGNQSLTIRHEYSDDQGSATSSEAAGTTDRP